MVWEECGATVVGEGGVLIGDVLLVEECGGTVVGEGVVLICDMLLVEECSGTVVGEGVVLICGVGLVFVGLLFCVWLDFVGRPVCSHICRLGIVGIGSLVLEH